MKRILPAIAICGALVAPAFADSSQTSVENMTCKEFMAMDSAGQTKAVKSMHGQKSSDSTATSSEESMGSDNEGMATNETMVENVKSECEGQPDMMVTDVVDDVMQRSTDK